MRKKKEWLKPDGVEMRNLDPAETEKREEQLVDILTPFFGCVPPFSYTVGNRCMERGLLPRHLLFCLAVLNFLSFAVLSAQKAQRRYGVRASVLLSMALDEFAFDIRHLARDPMICRDLDGRRSVSPNINRWFLARARRLATAKAFRTSRGWWPSPRAYIFRLCELGFCNSFTAEDLCSNIEVYGLKDCDLAGLLPIGEYASGEFDRVDDGIGGLVGVKPSPHRDLLRKGTHAKVAA